MDLPAVLTAVRSLSVEDRLLVVDTIMDEVAAEQEHAPLSEAKREELDRRIADDDANPEDVVSWEEAEGSILARLQCRAAPRSSVRQVPVHSFFPTPPPPAP
jgi:putative addiction module component (TIGR02574 family)